MGLPRTLATRPSPRLRLVGFLGVLVTFLTVGALGAFRYADAFALYRGFRPPHEPTTTVVRGAGGPTPTPVVRGTLQKIFVTSAAIGGRSQPVWVYLPPGYVESTRRYPVIYLLHGFPGNPESYLSVGQTWLLEDVLVAQHRMAPMIQVMPFGSTSLISDKEWANGVEPASGWETFVARDVVGAIDRRYRTIASAEGRALAGLSEGGYGALNIALHHPGEFDVVESWSGYMWAARVRGIFGTSPGVLAQNSPMLTVTAAAPTLRHDHVFVWFYIGADDKLLAENEQFAAELRRLGIANQFFAASGGHSWGLWRRFTARALIVASSHFAHA